MSQHTVTINVANKRLKIACPAGHESALLQAAEEINKRLEKDTKKSANMKSPEQALVMMSLNLANDLIQARADLEQEREKMQSKIELLQTTIEQAVNSPKSA
jgi:cell division protein ZapA